MAQKRCSECFKIIGTHEKCECSKKKRNEYMKERYDDGKVDKKLNCNTWRLLRDKIIKKDGGFCQRCYALRGEIITENLTVDHIKSRRDYPELVYDEENLITMCQSCNSEKGNHNYLDFEKPNIRGA